MQMQRQPVHGLPTFLPHRWRASIRYRLATWKRHPGRAAIASLTLLALCTATAFAIRALVSNLYAAPWVSSSFEVSVPKDLDNHIGRPLRAPSFDTLALKPSIRMLPEIQHRGFDRQPTASLFHEPNAITTVIKDIGVLESSSTHGISFVRLPAYDYDEVKGMVVLFKHAYVTGDESVIYDCSTVYRPGGADVPHWNPYPLSRVHPAVNEVPGTAVLIAQYWGSWYYHWFIESFLRLALVRDFLLQNPSVKVIAYDPPRDGLWLLHELIGLDRSRFISYSPRSAYKVERLLVPTATALIRANTRAARQFRDLFREQWSKRHPELCDRKDNVQIVIQHRGSGSRTISNHDDLVEAIRRKFSNADTVVFAPSDSVPDMITMHYNADIVVGPHGAGLSNSMFMRAGASILEIYMKVGMLGNDWYNDCHKITATKLNVSYTIIRSDSGEHGSELFVNVDRVLQVLEPIVNKYEAELAGKRLT